VKDPETRYAVRSYRDDDAAQLVAAYNEFNASRSFSIVRTPEYWTGFANSPEAETYEPCIAVYQNRVVGYALGQPCGDSYGLAEMACLKGHEACLRDLAHRIWSRATSRGAKQLLYRLPGVPEVEQAIVDIAIPVPARPYTHIMLRILNLRSVFEKILPELELRSLAERGRGQVTLSTTNGCVTLDVSPGHVELSDRPSSWTVHLTQPQLLDLLFGLNEPREILPETSGSGLLAKLFPKQDAMFYVPDAF
jgi:hypothetical protein